MILCTNCQTFSAIFLFQLFPFHNVIEPMNVSTLTTSDYPDYPQKPYKFYCFISAKDWTLCLFSQVFCYTNQLMIAYLFVTFLFINLLWTVLILFLFYSLLTFANSPLNFKANFLDFRFIFYCFAIRCLKFQSYSLKHVSFHHFLCLSMIGLKLSFPIIFHTFSTTAMSSCAVLSIWCFQTTNFLLSFSTRTPISLFLLLTQSSYFLTCSTKYDFPLSTHQNAFQLPFSNLSNCCIYSPKTNIMH